MTTKAPRPITTPMMSGLPVVRMSRAILSDGAFRPERRAIMGGGAERRVPLERPERVEKVLRPEGGGAVDSLGGTKADIPEPAKVGLGRRALRLAVRPIEDGRLYGERSRDSSQL